MLAQANIFEAIHDVAPRVKARRVSYFGSYAQGTATSKSDLDILVEFDTPGISLLTLIDFKDQLEQRLGIPVDVVHGPVPEGSMIEIKEIVPVYESA